MKLKLDADGNVVVVDGKPVYLCGEGRLVNLACGEGHPSTVMALSFCDQALGVEYGIKNLQFIPHYKSSAFSHEDENRPEKS